MGSNGIEFILGLARLYFFKRNLPSRGTTVEFSNQLWIEQHFDDHGRDVGLLLGELAGVQEAPKRGPRLKGVHGISRVLRRLPGNTQERGVIVHVGGALA